jgi:HEPN domain-containing protein
VFEPLLSEALALDKLYIPTRYPDALADLTPAEAYTREEAKTALDKATRIVTAVGEHIGTAD